MSHNALVQNCCCGHTEVTVQFEFPNYIVSEGDGTVEVCLTKNRVTAMVVAVGLRLMPGTAS